MNKVVSFIAMNGHGIYVWSAYGCVISYLTVQWLYSWRKWKLFFQSQVSNNEPSS